MGSLAESRVCPAKLSEACVYFVGKVHRPFGSCGLVAKGLIFTCGLTLTVAALIARVSLSFSRSTFLSFSHPTSRHWIKDASTNKLVLLAAPCIYAASRWTRTQDKGQKDDGARFSTALANLVQRSRCFSEAREWVKRQRVGSKQLSIRYVAKPYLSKATAAYVGWTSTVHLHS